MPERARSSFRTALVWSTTGVKYGANVNRLAKNTNRDFVETPLTAMFPAGL